MGVQGGEDEFFLVQDRGHELIVYFYGVTEEMYGLLQAILTLYCTSGVVIKR